VLHFIQPLFCDDHHQTRYILQVHEKVHQLSLASFVSSAKLLVLDSDPWSVPWSLFCHLPQESRISAAWIFSRNSVMALYLSTCSCTGLMTRLLCHGTSEMLAWILFWGRSSCILSAVVAENTSSELDLRRKWWKIWPVQHHLLLQNSRLINISWEIIWSFRSH
jgi:hypothetical protein